ncbi:hypothetical protein [Desulfovibrio psychrotolerans]|uniref:Glycosyl transferase family 2 n=1 Tax=Desulfovibrio psychrotolerans TaxID=415242 RepID=A0A7J0BVI0_9BACT|nr:hypothetical protein [Desulfovibrio psychrotolerans]GFM37165.1 hypothetical protein DSM19430T_18490 [Desulfovibrio psychrotolerans]
MIRDLLHAYTAAVLPFRLGAAVLPAAEPQALQTQAMLAGRVRQALRVAERAGRPHFLLLGAGDGLLADALADTLPDGVTMTVVELQPERVRQAMQQGRLGWWQRAGRHRLVADASPWAVLVLLAQAGLDPRAATMMLHPQLPEDERESLRRWQRLFAGAHAVFCCADHQLGHAADNESGHTAGHPLSHTASLTLGLIVHPDEPGLEDFFAQVPAWLHEVVVVWDAPQVPAAAAVSAACAVPVRHSARPLEGDFAAQRNSVLALCNTEWILFLDGDERLPAGTWNALPVLMKADFRRAVSQRNEAAETEQAVHAAGQASCPECRSGMEAGSVGGFAFPRWTRVGDAQTCRAGFGLWPDMQLRLLRPGTQTRFENKVHEAVRGLSGPVAVMLTGHMDHFSHVWKDPQTLAGRLSVFDDAAGRTGMHRLNEEYPGVPCAVLRALEKDAGPIGATEHGTGGDPACKPDREVCLVLPGTV